ncbi:MAG: hypothetical protein A2104_10310 [Candidatus Melainabacteria bacterium GWF2_32_7]|nr:MAG: hypothetical protein A2104_10310 [Candidatus Melainabacteria bacterium GWF2_32_7]
MHFRFLYKRVVAVFLVGLFFTSSIIWPDLAYGRPDNEVKLHGVKSSIEAKRKAAKAKIDELKRKEKIEIKKLYQSQRKLEATKNDIEYCSVKLHTAKSKLTVLESQLSSISYEQNISARRAGERIKQIYKGERISILHLIFAAHDINTFLDRVYYQQRLAEHDKKLLQDLRLKTRRLVNAKQDIEYQKNSIVSTIGVMNQKKSQITSSISVSQYMISKLRTDRSTYEAAEKELARQSQSIASMIGKSSRKSSIRTNTGFLRPVTGIISSPFGWRRHPIFGSRSFHSGVDIAGKNRSPIRASNTGEVVFTGWYGGYGKVVIVNHGKYKGTSTSTLYAHLSSTAVSVGQEVKQGQTVGYEGSTGYSTGPHLHFEVRLEGKPTNPLNYIP